MGQTIVAGVRTTAGFDVLPGVERQVGTGANGLAGLLRHIGEPVEFEGEILAAELVALIERAGPARDPLTKDRVSDVYALALAASTARCDAWITWF